MLSRRAALLTLLLAATLSRADDKELAATIKQLNANVLATDADKTRDLAGALGRDVRRRIEEANRRESDAWAKVRNRTDWEKYRDPRIDALRKALGDRFQPTDKPTVHVTKTIAGEGYRIENVVFESQPGIWVTANLYLPAKPPESMPGILLCHSHHSPKTQGELQDMGILWARLGCAVLVMDQVGHGERRQHPFVDEKSYPKPYRVGRQDYHFRYNTGLQLSLIGESLTGWMATDLRRGVDVLLARKGVDPERIALLGSVAGGGDPTAVTGALDRRIKAVVPFNFGGPQPETRYPLPDGAERTFNYAGGGSWESTRNLRLSARDGFLPWVIVGAVAPRGLIYGHEFAWDRQRDPVWKRLESIWGFHDAADRLAFAHGKGTLSGQPPESSHCNNIGREHRKLIYPAFERWLKVGAPVKENETRHPSAELMCWTTELRKELTPRTLAEAAAARADEQLAAFRKKLAEVPAQQRRQHLVESWNGLLGMKRPGRPISHLGKDNKDGVIVERVVLEGDVPVPLLLLRPAKHDGRAPVVVAWAQDGKGRFLKDRSAAIAALLNKGVAVCLPDLGGTGETSPGGSRGRQSSATSLSSSEQMLGGTLLGRRLADLLDVLNALARHEDIDSKRMALWGESFAPVNKADADLGVPLELDQPALAEPLGGLLALLAALNDERVSVVLGRGGLVSFRSALDSQFLHVPHDALLPGATTIGDLEGVLNGVTAKVRLEGLVDGLNRRVGVETARKTLSPGKNVELVETLGDEAAVASWLAERLR